MKKTLLLGLMLVGLSGAAPAPEMKLWRLDCGTLSVSDFGIFSDSGSYRGEKRDMVDSCYLIKHGNDYMLWDSGLPAEVKGQKITEGPFTLSLAKTIIEQLAEIGVTPDMVTTVGISHYHDDHTGQVRFFPKAKLLLGRGDLEAFKAAPATGGQLNRARLKPWLDDGAPSEGVARDKDVFGDGSVMMLNMVGHTPGHHVLLVNLPKTGPVLLSGDQFHAQSSYDGDEVPIFNTDRADTLASHDRFKRLAKNMKATVIIQHEPADVKKLPAFPKAAE